MCTSCIMEMKEILSAQRPDIEFAALQLMVRPDSDGKKFLVFSSNDNVENVRGNVKLLSYARLVYDCTHGEIIGHRAPRGHISCIDEKVVDLEGVRIAGLPAWDQSGNSVLGVLEGVENGRLQTFLWQPGDGLTVVPAFNPTFSLLGLRTHEAPVCTHWVGENSFIVVDRPPLEEQALVPQIFDSQDMRWPSGFIASLLEASQARILLTGPKGIQAINGLSAIVDMTVSPDGSGIILGSARTIEELSLILEEDLIPYQYWDFDNGKEWLEIGVLPRGSVRFVYDEGHYRPVFVENGEQTTTWDVITGQPLAQVEGQVKYCTGVPGKSGIWTTDIAPGSICCMENGHKELGRLVINVKPVNGNPDVAHVQTVASSDLPHHDYLFQTANDGQPIIKELHGSQPIYSATDKTIELHSNHAGVQLISRGSDFERQILHWPAIHSCYTRHTAMIPLGSGAAVRITAPETLNGHPPLIWLEPVQADCVNFHKRPFQVDKNLTLQPGTPEWCHSAERVVMRVFLPLGWGPDIRFQAILDRLNQHLSLVKETAKTMGWETNTLPAVGGHSFGAAVAAVCICHALIQADSAILRSGAYNRLMTPRGFQFESRSIFEARDIYEGFTVVAMADRIGSCRVMLSHGEQDTNVSTPHLQSIAFYEALSAAKIRSRLLLLPSDGHTVSSYPGIKALQTQEQQWINNALQIREDT